MKFDGSLWRHIETLFRVVLLLSISHHASADWYVHGAQYRCAESGNEFVILPYDESSENPRPRLEPGYSSLPNGITNLVCPFGKRTLKAKVSVIPPQERGMCMGTGRVEASSISISGVELLVTPLDINWDCVSSSEIVQKISVQGKGPIVEIAICTLDRGEDKNLSTKCQTRTINIEKVAAAHAREDHQLAGTGTQEQQSAARLPPQNDLAKVFPGRFPAGSDVPLCAHWQTDRGLRDGRIAGKNGERVYLRRANPQLCQRPDGDGCKPKAYVLPGDRVEVGFICGEWAQVRYVSRVRGNPGTKGWVETSRLYGVESVKKLELNQRSVVLFAPSVTSDDPLVIAAREGDIDKIGKLITAGANPDGTDKSGAPLIAAIQKNDIAVVKALLERNANPNAQSENPRDKCLVVRSAADKPEMLQALVKSNIDLNCRYGESGWTFLIEIAQFNRLQAWEQATSGGAGGAIFSMDPMGIASHLLRAGADPNARDKTGGTALLYTIYPNNVDVAKLLLEFGARSDTVLPDSREENDELGGHTLLMDALVHYELTLDPTMFKMLLERGANPNFRNSLGYNADIDQEFNGQTVLTRAAAKGYYAIVKLLLDYGADPEIPRADGGLADFIADEKGHYDVAQLIRARTKR